MKDKKRGASKYALKVAYRSKLSGARHYMTTNQGQPKKMPLPLPLFMDA
jgi:hypothetical protein